MLKLKYNIIPFSSALANSTAEVIKRNLEMVNCKDYPEKVIKAMIKYYNSENLIELAEKRDVYIVEVDGSVKGTVSLEGNSICTVFVDPDCHGTGLGKILMEYIEKIAAERGYEATTLDASLTAYPFYEKMGYREIEPIESEEFGKAIVMEKLLIP